jgi:pheromone a factor receptor
VLPVISLICAALLLLVLPFQCRARNAPVLAAIGWLLVANVSQAINTMIWDGNVRIIGTAWCDIGKIVYRNYVHVCG